MNARVLFACFLFFVWAAGAQESSLRFQHFIVDDSAQRPMDVWGKAVGDLNQDGRVDLLAGGHRANGLVWYENSGDMGRWKRHRIAAEGAFATDIEVADLDGDGDLDVVTIENGLVWFEHPGAARAADTAAWVAHRIAKADAHDLELSDIDGDGRLDIVARNQGEWGKGDVLFVHLQSKRGAILPAVEVPIPDGEGLLVADLNTDGKPDLVVNGVWLENLNKAGEAASWRRHTYARQVWRNLFLAVGDIDGDGRPDIVASPSERDHHPAQPIQWFQAPRDVAAEGEWVAHVVARVQPVQHYCGVADFDGDGEIDIAVAAMTQGNDPDRVTVYRNAGRGAAWQAHHLAETGSHSMRIADLNGDGKPDLYGVNWNTKASPNGAPVEIWINETPK